MMEKIYNKLMRKKKTKFKHEFVPYGEPWPEWAVSLVGVSKGYEAFESSDECNAFLEEYRELHKNDKPKELPKEEEPTVGRIGF